MNKASCLKVCCLLLDGLELIEHWKKGYLLAYSHCNLITHFKIDHHLVLLQIRDPLAFHLNQ